MNARLEELSHQVADLAPEARARYFAEAQVDEETRREVESLLAFESGASERLMRDIGAAAGRALPQVEPVGLQCGPYRLRSVIGRGGMGIVYLAERVDGEVAQRVAVKLLPLGAGDPLRERFLQERQILASLTHPNIARMLDAGHIDNGQPFLAMEYVEGQPIDVFAAGLPLRQKIELFLKVCAAAAYMHRNLIVHRDFKPSNILVTAEGEPKLLDFGIAKLLDLSTDSTITNLRVMTPDYASPEQVTGKGLSTATDIYSLGAVLYRLLTGKPAHEFESQSPEVIAAVITSRDVTRPSRWAPELKGDLDIILMKALRKDPQERYGTVEHFAEDLARYLRNEPITARPDSLLYRTRKFVMRHRAGMAAALIAVVALVAGTGIAFWQARQSAMERDMALTELRRAEATNDFSSFLLSEARPAGGKPISNAELLASGEALIATRFSGDPALRIHLLITLADRYYENQQFQDRARVLEQAYRESRSIQDPGLRSLATCQWASQLSERGQHQEAFQLLDPVLSFLAAQPNLIRIESQCRVMESIVASQASDVPRQIRAAERASLLEDRLGSATARQGDALSALANAYNRGGRYQDSNRTFERFAELLRKEHREDSREMAVLLNSWGTMLHDAGQILAAVPLAERAVRVARATDAENGASLTMLSTYGLSLLLAGRYPEADTVLQQALAKARTAGSVPRLIVVLGNATEAAFEAGDLRRSRDLLAEARGLLKANSTAPLVLHGLVDLSAARVALAGGANETSLELCRSAVATLQKARAGAFWEAFLSRVLNANGRFSEALSVAQHGVDGVTAKAREFPYNHRLAFVYLELAIAQKGLGDVDAARKSVDLSLAHATATLGALSKTTQRAEALRRQLSEK